MGADEMNREKGSEKNWLWRRKGKRKGHWEMNIWSKRVILLSS